MLQMQQSRTFKVRIRSNATRSSYTNNHASDKWSHGKTHGRVRYVADENADNEGTNEFVDSVFTVEDQGNSEVFYVTPALRVPVTLHGVDMDMEVDTGATVSVMNYTVYNKHFKHLPLESVERKLHAYSGIELDIAGQIKVHVNYNGQEATLPIVVIKADRYAPPLLGRDWLKVIKLDWHKMFSSGKYCINTEGVEELKAKYADIF